MAEQLHETELGRKFFEQDIPSIADSLKRIAARLEIIALAQPVDKAHQRAETRQTPSNATSEKDAPVCPECESGMTTRARRKDGNLFWGCIRYPECNGTRPYSDEDYQRKTGVSPKQEGGQPKPELRAELRSRLHGGPRDDDIPF